MKYTKLCNLASDNVKEKNRDFPIPGVPEIAKNIESFTISPKIKLNMLA